MAGLASMAMRHCITNLARKCQCNAKMMNADTVNSRYSGHPRDHDLVSVIARVRNSGVRENFYFKPYLQKGSHVCSFSLTPVSFPDPLSHAKSVKTFFIYKQSRT